MKKKTIAGLIAIVAIVAVTMLAGCVDEGAKTQTIQLTVIYYEGGEWSGSYGDVGSIKSVDGTGTETFTITDAKYGVSGTFQKKDDTAEPLTVQILKNGQIKESETTTAAYGVVSISYTL